MSSLATLKPRLIKPFTKAVIFTCNETITFKFEEFDAMLRAVPIGDPCQKKLVNNGWIQVLPNKSYPPRFACVAGVGECWVFCRADEVSGSISPIYTFAMIVPKQKLLIVNGTPKQAENIVDLLKHSNDPVNWHKLKTVLDPESVMIQWVLGGSVIPDSLEIVSKTGKNMRGTHYPNYPDTSWRIRFNMTDKLVFSNISVQITDTDEADNLLIDVHSALHYFIRDACSWFGGLEQIDD